MTVAAADRARLPPLPVMTHEAPVASLAIVKGFDERAHVTDLSSSSSDDDRIDAIRSRLLAQAGSLPAFTSGVGKVLRRAFDEVIDTPRTGRFTLSELEKTEKTYLGTKVEILLRDFLRLRRGRVLDLNIDGVEVDVKNTIGSNWTIPGEAINHPCILIRSDERTARCWCGLIVARRDYLNRGQNRDGKTTISALGLSRVIWMLDDVSYPANFWESVDTTTRNRIMSAGGGTERIAQLFRLFQGHRISRDVVAAVAQQKDYMKRLRRNGGARDKLASEQIVILWGKNDDSLISRFGLPSCTSEEFVSYAPTTSEEVNLLRSLNLL